MTSVGSKDRQCCWYGKKAVHVDDREQQGQTANGDDFGTVSLVSIPRILFRSETGTSFQGFEPRKST
jgi:hypothetical protein